MPLRVNLGLSRKVGLPDYGSVGASCHIELELDSGLLQNDMETFQRHVRGAYAACNEAIHDQLAGYQQGGSSAPAQNGNGHHNGSNGNGRGSNGNGRGRNQQPRKATASQVRALNAIADRLQLNLSGWLSSRYGVDSPEALSITDASRCIEDLNNSQAAENNGGRH